MIRRSTSFNLRIAKDRLCVICDQIDPTQALRPTVCASNKPNHRIVQGHDKRIPRHFERDFSNFRPAAPHALWIITLYFRG
jgi:hypothetical protein